MKVERNLLVDLLIALGYKAAKGWNNKKLAIRAKKYIQDTGDDLSVTKKQKALYEELAELHGRGKKCKVIGDDGETPTGDDDVKKDKKSKKDKSSKDKKKSKMRGPIEKVGIIDYLRTLVSAATKDKPLTRSVAIDKVHKKFPDRERSSLSNTIGMQLSVGLRKSGMNIKKVEERGGGYYLGKGKSK